MIRKIRLLPVFYSRSPLADGIFIPEYGAIFGTPRRSDILAASRDLLSLDMVGAKLLGYEPCQIRRLAHMAEEWGRPIDLSDVKVAGERIEDLASFHKSGFVYDQEGSLPQVLEKMGIKGLKIYQPDHTVYSNCAPFYLIVTTAIATGWKGEPFDNVEILTGKIMQPQPGMKKTILMGDCMKSSRELFCSSSWIHDSASSSMKLAFKCWMTPLTCWTLSPRVE